MTENAELQLQIDLADVKFTSLQTQLNASLWVGWVPQILVRNTMASQYFVHLFSVSIKNIAISKRYKSLSRDVKVYPIFWDLTKVAIQLNQLRISGTFYKYFVKISVTKIKISYFEQRLYFARGKA